MILEFRKNVWKDLDFPDIKPIYEISNQGKVRRKSDKRELSIHYSEKGYAMVSLISITKGRQITKKLHRLIAYVFLGKEYFKIKTVNHINGDKTNNSVTNLEYVDFDYNIRHSYELGLNTPRKGSLNGMSLINENIAERLCSLIQLGLKAPKIVRILDEENIKITKHIVHDIKRKRTWRHVSDKYNFK